MLSGPGADRAAAAIRPKAKAAVCAGPAIIAVAGCLSLAGCVGADPGTPPASGFAPGVAVPGLGEAAVPLPAARQTLTPAACEVIHVAPDDPRRTPLGQGCEARYLVHLVIEAEEAAGPLLEMFRSYPVADWRIQEGGGRLRHSLSLLWDPYGDGLPWEDLARTATATQPLMVRPCPGEIGGRVAACSDVSCAWYDHEDQVPAIFLPAQRAVFTMQPDPRQIHPLREGQSLTVVVTYRINQPLGIAQIRLTRDTRDPSSRRFRMVPSWHRVEDSRGSHTAGFRIHAVADGIAQAEEEEEFALHLNADLTPTACTVVPPPLRVRVSN